MVLWDDVDEGAGDTLAGCAKAAGLRHESKEGRLGDAADVVGVVGVRAVCVREEAGLQCVTPSSSAATRSAVMLVQRWARAGLLVRAACSEWGEHNKVSVSTSNDSIEWVWQELPGAGS